MDLGFNGKVVLVSGGSKGIGLAAAKLFVQEGAKVAIVSRDAGHVAAAVSSLGGSLGLCPGAVGYTADLNDAEAARRVVRDTERDLGAVDVLVNCAGSARRIAADDIEPGSWNEALVAKFFPYMHLQDAVLQRMRERALQRGQDGSTAPRWQAGAVVNVVGTGGRRPTETHLPGCAANAALLLTTVGLAKYYARYGVRINAVNPSVTLTGRMDETLEAESRRQGIGKDEALARGAAATPLRRYGRPQEIADVIAFVASERASYVVGALISADGGQRSAL